MAGSERFTEHGFHTGDLGYVDQAGRVFVTGRLDDRIVTGGQTVDPEEVRSVLRAHPAARDAAVLGLDDEQWGERVGALVVTGGVGGGDAETGANASGGKHTTEGGNRAGRVNGANDHTDDGGNAAVSAAALEAFCRERLARYKLPRTIAFAEALPRTNSGTVDRVAVARRLRDAGSN
jgi:O-succinylbenzoic acid--CoA ligase